MACRSVDTLADYVNVRQDIEKSRQQTQVMIKADRAKGERKNLKESLL